tara:strand:- start:10861 stop:11745 length:885 start_codon:yes stop_codon:yes gene_type:complete
MNSEKISSVASELNTFQNKKYLQGTRQFLQSNSMIAKLAFLILVVFVFVILLRIGSYILASIFSYSSDPVLLNGTMKANQLVVVAQDPNTSGSIPILRSKNQRDGLEFTWSVWLWVDEPPLSTSSSASTNQYKHVFSKGSDQADAQGIMTPNNGPGLYIGPNYRELMFIMSTFENPKEEIIIGDIPIRKWINVIIRCDQHKLDIFINGMMTRSHILKGVPKQNYDNVYIGLNGGFAGDISTLQYFAYALGTNKIQTIVDAGPNLTMLDKDLRETKPYYLSFRWFFPEQNREVQF